MSIQSCLGPSVFHKVPDGGWGWAVALAFFMVEVCTYGTIKSLGVFLHDLMNEFGEGTSRVSWVISICVFVFTFTAPLSTMLSTYFGFRPVVMMGGFLISLGTITSAFTTSINQMYMTMGVVSGLGYCLAFLPTLTILTHYFSKRRALVTSAASSGESFAIFAFAPAFTLLKEHIGWRNCLLLLGVLQSSVIGCGVLLRPLIIQPEPEKAEDAVRSVKQLEAVYEPESRQTQTFISSGTPRGSADSGVTSLCASTVDLRTAGGPAHPLVGWEETPPTAQESVSEPPSPQKLTQEKEKNHVEAGSVHLSRPKLMDRTFNCPTLLDFSMLADASFIFYSLFGLFATLGFFAPQLYVVELSKSRGVEPKAASCMLSVMAAAEVVGRLSVGVIMNSVCFRKTLVLLACAALLSLVLVVFTLVQDFWGLALCCALYGYFLGTVCSTHIPLLAEDEVVGVDKMASSVGVYVFIQSFAGLAGPPLGGVLVDLTGNYGAAFYSCATGMAMGSVCLALVGPAKSGFCHRTQWSHAQTAGSAQDCEQADFLDVDLAPEESPVRKTVVQNGTSDI